MDRKLKILELLEKKNLSEQETNELERLVGNDSDLQNLVSTYSILGDVVNHSSHLTEEEISEYILYKNSLAEDTALIHRIPFIENHLRKCSVCSEIFKDLNNEFTEIDNYLAEKSTIETQPQAEIYPLRGSLQKKYKAPRYAFTSVIILGLVYIVLYFTSALTTPSYYKNAELVNEYETSISRGRATENFRNSLSALEENDYDKAIAYLKKDIEQNPDDETIFYSYYIIGLTYLRAAEHNFLGLFPGYNEEQVMKGKEYLEKSVTKNNSGRFINIKLNTYFYLAKACLMQNDKKSAERYLSMVIDGKGSRMQDARKLLDDLE